MTSPLREILNIKLTERRVVVVVRWEDMDQIVQTFSYKMSISSGMSEEHRITYLKLP